MPEKESTQPQEYKRSRFGGLELSKLSKKDIATALLKISLLTGGVAAATGTAMAQEGGTDAPTVEAVPEAPTANPNETAPAPTEVAPNGVAVEAGVTLTQEQIMEMPTEFLQLNAEGVMESVTVKSVGIRNNETAAMNEAGEVVMVHKEGLESGNEWFIVALTIEGNVPWRVLLSPNLNSEEALVEMTRQVRSLFPAISNDYTQGEKRPVFTSDARLWDSQLEPIPTQSAQTWIAEYLGVSGLHPVFEGVRPTNGIQILDRSIEYAISSVTGLSYQEVKQRLATGESFDVIVPGGKTLQNETSTLPTTPEENQTWRTENGIDIVVTRNYSDDDFQIMNSQNTFQDTGMPVRIAVDRETGTLQIRQQELLWNYWSSGFVWDVGLGLSELTLSDAPQEDGIGAARVQDRELIAILLSVDVDGTYMSPIQFAGSAAAPVQSGEAAQFEEVHR